MLLQALNEFYNRATRDGLIQDAAFTNKYVRWVIPIDLNGNLIGGGLQEIPEPKKGGRTFSAPRSSRAKNAGGVAEFLWEGIEALFNLPADPDLIETNERKRASQIANRRAKFDDYWRQIAEAVQSTQHPLLLALISFRQKYLNGGAPDFLRWGISPDAKPNEKAVWWAKTASGTEEKMKADSFTFRVDGRLLLDDAELREHWKTAFSAERSVSEGGAEKGLCLVTGAGGVPISDSHLPKISRVPGAVATGAALISFDKDSFCSYGLEKSRNSPISFAAVEAYTNALNFLVSDPKHSFKVGNTVVCFWAQNSDEVTDWLADLFDQPQPQTVRAFLSQPFRGVNDMKSLDDERFYSVTLGGNAGRVVVRNWMQTSVRRAIENVRDWFADLNIVTLRRHENDKYAAFSLYWLAAATVRETKDLRAETTTQLYRAALENHAPSLALAKNLLDRLAVELAQDGSAALLNLSRFALLKLIINRNEKDERKMIEPQLTADTDDAAYNCGRLLAVFNELQAAAHDYKLEGASVVERYYGTAASSPNSAFGILWRLHQHHLKKIARQNPGKAQRLKEKIAEISMHFRQPHEKLPPQFPRSFNLQAQGRFALGFYQQIAADKAARQAYLDEKKQTENTTQTNQLEGDDNQ